LKTFCQFVYNLLGEIDWVLRTRCWRRKVSSGYQRNFSGGKASGTWR